LKRKAWSLSINAIPVPTINVGIEAFIASTFRYIFAFLLSSKGCHFNEGELCCIHPDIYRLHQG
jgi:hypothetical protein